MARVRLWEKKRGDRSTGSRLVGTVGESLFFGALCLIGAGSLTAHIAAHSSAEAAADYGFWLAVLAWASLVFIGGGGVILSVLRVGTSAERRSALARRAADLDLLADSRPSPKDFPNVPDDSNLTNSPGVRLAWRLPMATVSLWRLLTGALFCLFWNGIAVVLAVLTLQSIGAGDPDWAMAAFMLVFVVPGVWSVKYFASQMAIHAGIGPTGVEVSDHPLCPGGQYEIFLSQAGRLSMQRLEIKLVCEEETTYRQGTDVRTETQPVFEDRLFAQENFRIEPGIPFEQQFRLQIPIDGMHSFQSRHNSVHWKVLVSGVAESWPPFERSFPLIVYPGSNGNDAGDRTTD